MKTLLPKIFFVAAALSLGAATQASDTAPAGLSKTMRLERYVEPMFPLQLRNTSVGEGFVQVQLLVAADGQLQELFVSAYSHPAFAETVERAVRDWGFRAADPAQTADLPQRYNLRFSFQREGMIVVQGDFEETIRAFLRHPLPDKGVEICKLRDLDTMPEAVNLVVPAYPAELKQQKVQGAATVSFFIDEEGRVRVPSIVEATRPEFARAALEAVRQWTFAPPLRKGAPTRVLAVQDFTFVPERAGSGTPVTSTAVTK